MSARIAPECFELAIRLIQRFDDMEKMEVKYVNLDIYQHSGALQQNLQMPIAVILTVVNTVLY